MSTTGPGLPEGICGLVTAVVGAAREGMALVRYLLHYGADVTLTDSKPAEVLLRQGHAAQHLRELLTEAQGLHLALGHTPPALLDDLDVLFVSPGVPPSAPIVQQARERGLPLSSEPRLFTQLCPAPIVGITGSSGKTTTTTLVGRMYAVQHRTWVGGNIGQPLLERLLTPERPQVAVMELSSFQLELFARDYQGPDVEARRSPASQVIALQGWSPHIAAVTNITPNHLDRHPSLEDYARAKFQIIAYQNHRDWAVLNLDDAHTRAWGPQVHGRALYFSLEQPVVEGACLQGTELLLRLDGREHTLCQVEQVKLRGQHNLANILAAACCAAAGGVSLEAIRQVATTFAGVEHRLEVVRQWRDVTFVNDSIATSPERAMAALRAYREPLLLLAGGRDKHLPWEEWADLVLQRVRTVVAFGEARPLIARALEASRARHGMSGQTPPYVQQVATLEEAVQMAASLARPGDVVLLAPGGTSFDAFEDFEERGARFRLMVQALT